MRAFRLPAPVDLVVCEYSVFNHLSSPRDLLRAARSVARALRPGGTLLFDVTHRSSYEKRWAGSWWGEGPKLFAARRGGYDSSRRMGWVEIIWFSRTAKHWQRHAEWMEMREWRRSEVQRALKAAGFTHTKAHDGARLFAGEHIFVPGDKTFFVAQKARD
jgi:SAM-dependent methyltransferase